jgi:hypothetical protein
MNTLTMDVTTQVAAPDGAWTTIPLYSAAIRGEGDQWTLTWHDGLEEYREVYEALSVA